MRGVTRGLLGLFLVAAFPLARATAQTESGNDPVWRVLELGRHAFENSAWSAADSLAGVALATPGISRQQRIAALHLMAASNYSRYSENRHPQRALEAIQRLIQFAPLAEPPRALSWDGLDSLFAVGRRTTFGMAVTVDDSVEIRSFEGFVPLNVYTTRPADLVLTLQALGSGNAATVVDSAHAASQVTLRFQPVLGEQPRFPSGQYLALVKATDPETRQTRETRVLIDLSTPPLPLHRIPTVWDSTGARPVHTRPSRASSIVSGILVGAFTALTIRAGQPEELGDGPSPNSRALGWGVGLGVGTAIGSWVLDRGRRIPENERFNEGLYEEWVQTRRRMEEENRAWRDNYRGHAMLHVEET